MENRGGDTEHGFYWRSLLPLSQFRGDKERSKGKLRQSKRVGVAFFGRTNVQSLCSLFTSLRFILFYFYYYYYFNQDSSLQCLLRGVGVSDRTMRKCQESGAATAPSNGGGLKVFIPAAVPSRLIADIQPENLELTRHNSGHRLSFCCSPSEPPLLRLSETLHVGTRT